MSFSPRIVFPGFFIQTGKVGGAENAFYNLAFGLVKAGAIVDLFFFHEKQVAKHFIETAKNEPGLRIHFTGKETSRFIAEQSFTLKIKQKADAIIFPNYFTPPFVPKSLGKKVAIIHDCQYLHFPQYFPLQKRLWFRFTHELTLGRADKVITLSTSAKEDILKHYLLGNANKVSVIGNPVSWERFNKQEANWHPPFDKYILSVAHHYPHKNLDTLIKAFAIVSAKRPDLGLVLVGQTIKNLTKKLKGKAIDDDLIDRLGLRNKITITGFVDDQTLGALYEGATFFAFPSLFEGFGLPPVEALGLGITTLTTKCASLPEVTLHSAHYLDDPGNEEEWANRMLAIIDQPEQYSVPLSIQNQIRETYDLKKTGERYLDTIFA
jgi:glycosyltransferase involved in cell wall biosynthesis